MADDIEEIKRRIDIADFISQYIELKKAGRNFKAPCPFHTEKTPSFIVSPEKQIWHCFGCQKGGDHFGFLMEYEGIDFPDALKILADKAGIQLKPRDPKLKKTKDELYQINLIAAKFYYYILTKKSPGKKVLEYLEKERGLTKNTIRDFKLGYAPDSWDLLSKFLQKRGFDKADILKSGLVIPKEDGTFYDRFRNRVMFPISDIGQNIVGFSGRLFEKSQMATLGRGAEPAKYINSPDTPIYNKSRILYALDAAKKAIREKDQIIIVEGQMDVLACYQAGFQNTVASSGTAITLEQLETLKKFSENIAFAFDADTAGEQATKRAIATAHKADIIPQIIITPKDQDPADVIQKDPAIFKKAVQKAKPAVDFYFDNIKAKYGKKSLTSTDKQKISQELLPIIKEIGQPVLVGDYIKKLAKMIDSEERYLYEAFQKTKGAFADSDTATKEPQFQQGKKPRKDLIEQRILGLVQKYPQYLKQIFSPKGTPLGSKVKMADFQDRENIKIAKALQKSYTKSGKFSETKFKSQLTPAEKKLADAYYLAIEDEFGSASEKAIQEEIAIACQRLKSKRLENIKKDFQAKIAQAEAEGDRKKIKQLIIKLQQQIGE